MLDIQHLLQIHLLPCLLSQEADLISCSLASAQIWLQEIGGGEEMGEQAGEANKRLALLGLVGQ